MPISKISVKNFRSIEEAEIEPTKFNIFVGKNNHGKTNLFEAIKWFYTGSGSIEEIRYMHIPREVIVEIEITDLKKEIAEMKNEKNQATLEKQIGEYDKITIRRSSKDSKKRFLIIDGEEVPPGTGFDAALNDFLPELEYVHTKLTLDEVAGYKKTSPIGKMLSGVLSAILEENDDYRKFQDEFKRLFDDEHSEVRIELNNLGNAVAVYLKKQFNETEVEFKVANPLFEDLLKNFETHVDDGVKTTAEEKGDGMQRAIMLAIIQAYAEHRKSKNINRSFLFLIDEGELHLHPSAQRELKGALSDLSNHGDQVFLNTHSSVLLTADPTDQKLFKVEKERRTEITEVSQFEKSHIIYELLGGSPTDLLLPKNFLIVEGKSEYLFLKEVIGRFYSKRFENIQIIFAGGDIKRQERTMYLIHELLKPLNCNPLYKDCLVILCDKPITGKQISAMTEFQENYSSIKEGERLFILDSHNLEESYPEPFKKTSQECEELEETKSKASYASDVGGKISQEAFEKHMQIIFNAIESCERHAHS